MEFRGIRQTSHIDGVNRNPSTTEHDKALVWDNNTGKVKYVSYTSLLANSKTNNGYVTMGDSSSGANYIWKLDANKNPSWRVEEYLKSVARYPGGNSVAFTMNSGTTKFLQLGALAWEDSIDADIALPGNGMILFDKDDTVGGDSSLTFDRFNKTIDLIGFTGIQFRNNADVSKKSVLQYFGNKNILIGNGLSRSVVSAANLVNNVFIGDSTDGGSTTAQNNVRIGHFSGSSGPNNIEGSVYIGNYSGRLESANNKFYVGNSNYGTEAEFRNGSLLYGDFSTGWLRVNNRLEVPQEIKIGTFDVANSPSWGMLQFIETLTPGEYKPQYYDGTVWQDFASGANYYLDDVTKGTVDVGTTSDDYKLTFDMNGVPDITLQLGANAFNSDVIPLASPVDTYGYIQLSSGDIDDGNRGFTHSSALQWDEVNARLSINGDIVLGEMDLTGSGEGAIRYSNGHIYGFTKDPDDNFVWNQLDSDPSGIGQNNTITNIGLTGIGLFYQKDGIDLQLKNIDTIDDRILLVDNGTNKTIDIDLDLNPTAGNTTPSTSTTYSGSVLGSIQNPLTANPKLWIKPLISDTIQITETSDQVLIEVTGAGGGEANTASNVGTGIGLWKDKSGADLRFKSINDGLHNTVVSDGDGLHINIDVDDISLTDLGSGVFVTYQDADSFSLNQRTFIDGIATTVDTNGNEIFIDVNKEIPYVGWIETPVWTPSTPGNGELQWTTDFSSDIRTSATTAAASIAKLNIGDGLFYDVSTNTLKSVTSVGSPTDYRLTSVERDHDAALFHITDEFGVGVEDTVSLNLGGLAWVWDVEVADSIEGTGLSSSLRLVNDQATPGALRYYGTDSDGIKGFYTVEAIGGGTVSSITSGNGMDFAEIDASGEVVLGLPSTIDSNTENALTATSHTHELGDISTDNILDGSPVEYGALYNWYAATDARKILSSDEWVIPSKIDFSDLMLYLDSTGLGYSNLAGGKLKETGFVFFNSPNTGADNITKFNGRAAGSRVYSTGAFTNMLDFNSIWTSTLRFDGISADIAQLVYNDTTLRISYLGNTNSDNTKSALSIRPKKTSTTLTNGQSGTYTGNDGKIYRTICIGTQEWLADNLNETKYRDGSWITGYDGGVYTPIADGTWAALTTEAMCYYDDNEAYGGGQTPITTILTSLQNQITLIRPQAGIIDGITNANVSVTFLQSFNAIPVVSTLQVYRYGEPFEGAGYVNRMDVEYHFVDSNWLTTTGFSLVIDSGETLTGVIIDYHFIERTN